MSASASAGWSSGVVIQSDVDGETIKPALVEMEKNAREARTEQFKVALSRVMGFDTAPSREQLRLLADAATARATQPSKQGGKKSDARGHAMAMCVREVYLGGQISGPTSSGPTSNDDPRVVVGFRYEVYAAAASDQVRRERSNTQAQSCGYDGCPCQPSRSTRQ